MAGSRVDLRPNVSQPKISTPFTTYKQLMTPVRIRMFPSLAVVFLLVPILEIYLLIQVGALIGAMPTIGLVVLTAVVGVALLRAQGAQTFLRFNQALSEGRLPATEILEGAALLIGGALLLTPGFFTDLIGFICLAPFSRRALIKWLAVRYNPAPHANLHEFKAKRQTGNIYDGNVTRHHEDD